MFELIRVLGKRVHALPGGRSRLRPEFWIALVAPLLLAQSIAGATVTATVAAGVGPNAVAANPVTNKIYVTDNIYITIIDGVTNAATTVAAGTNPVAIAVNPLTNRIYVASEGSNNVTVLDGATNNAIATVALNSTPIAIALNPVTNKVYVVSQRAGSVTAIDGVSNNTAVITAGTNPNSIAINPVTNQIYVTNSGANNVTVIDGSTNSTSMVATQENPASVAVNPVTNKIYVANAGGQSVTVIDGATRSTTNVAVGVNPMSIAVNAVTNQIYVANDGSSNVTIINGATNRTVNVAAGTNPKSVVVNPLTNQIYAANYGSNSVTVIDGVTNSPSTLSAGSEPTSVVVNPVTNKIYVTDRASNNLTVIDGRTNPSSAVQSTASPVAADVNPLTNTIYVPDSSANSVSVIDLSRNSTATVAVGNRPSALVVNAATNQIYVANQGDGTVTVIDGATNNTTTITAGSLPFAIAVNPVTNQIYIANEGDSSVTVIDGATQSTSTVAVASNPHALAVNPVTNQIYVATLNSVSVIDGATKAAKSISMPGNPNSLAVNSETNKIYATQSNGLTIIDGATRTLTNIGVGTDPTSVAVNPVTNKIYVANTGSSNVSVIDGATAKSIATITVPASPRLLIVNPLSNRIFVGPPATNSDRMTVVDGATNTTTTVSGGLQQLVGAFNPVTNQVLVANPGNVTIISDSQSQPIQLTTAITPLTNNQSVTTIAPFTFTTSTSTVAQPDAAFYQFDTLQNGWTAAGGSSPSFSSNATSLQPGFHLLFAYATDGQEATSTQPSSPAIGAIQAYYFLVVPNPPVLSISVSHSGTFTQAQTGEWDVQMSNSAPSGSSSTSGVTSLVDTLPSSYTLASFSGSGWSCVSSSNTVTCGYSQPVAAGSNFPLLSLIVNVPVASPGSATNNVAAYGGGDTVHNSPANAATASDTVTVMAAPATQTIKFGAIAQQVVGTPLSLSATATSGLAVSFASSTPSVCTVSGNAATLLTMGTCTIVASQAGNASFQPASQVTQSFLVVTSAGAPSVISISPNSGFAATQLFSAAVSDPNGASDLNAIYLLFNTSVSPVNGCYVLYYPTSNQLYLKNDSGAANSASLTPGAAVAVSNSQCTVLGTGTSYSPNGNSAKLTVAITFAQNPLINSYVYASEKNGTNSGFVPAGTWGVAATAAPTITSVTPNSGSALQQTFSVTVADQNGANNLNGVYLLFNQSVTATHGCYIIYQPAANRFYLKSDDGTTNSATLTPGGAGTLSNSQCSVAAAGSLYTTSGTTATLQLAVTFTNASPNNIYAYAADKNGKNSGFVQTGLYGVSAGPPAVVSVTPASGSAVAQVFTAVYSDPNGASNLATLSILFNTQIAAPNSCFVTFNPLTNLLYLTNDQDTAESAGLQPGSASSVSNSQCMLSGAGSSYMTSGNTATLNVSLTFFGNSTTNTYLYAGELDKTNSGWVKEGTWTP